MLLTGCVVPSVSSHRSLGTSSVGSVGVGKASCCPTLHSSTLCRGEREVREGCQSQVYCAQPTPCRRGGPGKAGVAQCKGWLKEPLCNLRTNPPWSGVTLSPPSILLSSLAGGLRSSRNLKPWTLRRQSTWRPTCQRDTRHQVTRAKAAVRRGRSLGSG